MVKIMNEENKDVIKKIGELFQEYTKYEYLTDRPDMLKGKLSPGLEKEPDSKEDIIDLPEYEPIKEDFGKILLERKSRRNFDDSKPISKVQLSTLLFYIAGVRPDHKIHFRMAPSAGALHPLNTYVLVNNVEEMAPGLYLYIPSKHAIAPVEIGPKVGKLFAAACLQQKMVHLANITVIWTAQIIRASYKYLNRAYRYVYLDAGHACQNAYLVSEALGLGCCAVGAFDDNSVSKLLKIDGVSEFPLYMIPIGVFRKG